MQPTMKTLAMIQEQIRELEGYLEQAHRELNTVAAAERIEKWKVKTASLLGTHMGPREGQQFAAASPGPSFTNDLLEELGEDVEFYRDYLRKVIGRIQQASPPSAAQP